MASRSMATFCVAMILFAQVFVQADAALPPPSRRVLLQVSAPAKAPAGAPEAAPVESPEYAPGLAPTTPPPVEAPELSPSESPVAASPPTSSPGPAPLVSSASTTVMSSFSILTGCAAYFLF